INKLLTLSRVIKSSAAANSISGSFNFLFSLRCDEKEYRKTTAPKMSTSLTSFHLIFFIQNFFNFRYHFTNITRPDCHYYRCIRTLEERQQIGLCNQLFVRVVHLVQQP